MMDGAAISNDALFAEVSHCEKLEDGTMLATATTAPTVAQRWMEGMSINSELRKDCPMRHENGNCLPAGGFCTAVNDPICEALHNAHLRGYYKAAEKYTEVVRCKDCKHRYTLSSGVGFCKKIFQMASKDEDFCSYGERRTDV